MTENHIPTEQELDMLLERPPQFDPDVVKRRTLSRIDTGSPHPTGRLAPLRCIFIAAVICALSISTLAATNYVTGGGIAKVLGIQQPQTEEVPAPIPEAAEQPPAEEAAAPPEPVPEPELPQEEPPELDGQIASALQIGQAQAQQLRPAVQAVEQTVEAQDIRMTVLQTLGDPFCLYIKLRFDFPTELSVTGEAKFDEIEFSLDQARSYSWSYTVLEQTDRFVTYLLKVENIDVGNLDLNGQTATVSFENYGQPLYIQEHSVQFKLSDSNRRIIIVDPEGNVKADATESDVAALPSALDSTETTGDGFTIGYMADGTYVVTYDGTHGIQYVTVLLGDAPTVLTGSNPSFQAALEGSWTQSWQLSYQDPSVYWSGEAALSDPVLTMTGFRLSPLSWAATFIFDEFTSFSLSREWDAQLRHADGSLTDLPMKTSSILTNDAEFPCTMTEAQVFDQPIDISTVTAVIINGMEFPLNR